MVLLAWISWPTLSLGDETNVPATNAPPMPAVAAVAKSEGKLFICGGGILPSTVLEQFIDLAGGPASRIVYIPTASVYAGTEELHQKLIFWHEQLSAKKLGSFEVLHAPDRVAADHPDTVAPLKKATAVWFGGGVQSRLTERYLGTAVEREVKQLLARGGLVGGTSAGAAIMSDVMIRGGMPEPDIGPGFGFLQNAVVDQHFIKRNRHNRLVNALVKNPDRVGLGIDEGTALIVHGDRLEVVGESNVVVCYTTENQSATFQELKPGQNADLKQYAAKARQGQRQQVAKQTPAANAERGDKIAVETPRRDDMPQTGR